MATAESFQPDWVSPPGDTILTLLARRDLTVEALADAIDRPSKEVTDLVAGRTAITIGLARQLQEVLGASVEFWMARDLQYRQQAKRLAESETAWLSDLPLSDMVRFGWLSPPPLPGREVAACLDFFGVSSVREWERQYLEAPSLASFRTSQTLDSNAAAVATWLRQAQRVAQHLEIEVWDKEGFRASLPDMRALTRVSDPDRFLPELRQRCARHGVALVVLPTPKGCRASGAAAVLDGSRALIQLSFRFLSDDQFWFSFFHEAGHIVLHGDAGLHVDADDTPKSIYEAEANTFSQDLLVPPEWREKMLRLDVSHKSVIRFARRIGVSPGVVVGQLQHSGRIGYDTLNRLKRRYQWDEPSQPPKRR